MIPGVPEHVSIECYMFGYDRAIQLTLPMIPEVPEGVGRVCDYLTRNILSEVSTQESPCAVFESPREHALLISCF